MEKRPFSELGLSPDILKAVDKMGFEEASPIQTAVIPHALTGRDVVGQSATGSGKTAAFAIPAIEKVDVTLKKVQVLVLCPTRELAVQVAEECGKLGSFKRGLMEVPIYGGQSYERQFRALAAGAQVVIGTPGRVMDHMERGTLRLDTLKVVVLDEADRMLDMGFRDDIERILSAVPETRQCLFFSATMPRGIQELIKRYTRDPEWVKIEAHAQNAPKVEQIYFEVDRRSKIEVLTRLIDLHDFRFGIIFCSTKIMVDELDEHLHARGYSVDRLHGDITQAQRTRVMDKFRRRGFEFLIATDVAARGLDVDDLEVVFNFDLPNDAEDYTHRIGRTGRAGKTGMAFTFVSGREIYKLQGMVHYARLKIRRERVPSLDEVEEAKGNVFFEKLRATLEEKKFKSHDQMVDRLLEMGYTSTDIASALIHLMGGDTAEPVKKTAKVRAEHIAANEAPTDRGQSAAPRVAEPSPARRDAGPPARTETSKPVPSGDKFAAQKRTYDRKPRTGREPGFTVVSFNVGRQQLVTPADLVGKIAGVTRLPANTVGAIDIHEDYTHVDVACEHAELVVAKLAGIRIKNQSLKLSIVPATGA
ncbi:DEAD/DEAH box helicase [Oleiharenicola lentus]|uniref:DEAD-box ATP-dependent RNA helicase RhpA n=1 Tax=Oleiharenicola lentus TaxID=2508720 RepID=A0A4Q1C9F9_9BACT|nr:DEAD/DEAH box helicase [Oleiharenicola lentus]RXK55588.1 DEAD/DEAH box helicase [Oleiharenicola lentus]